MFQAQTTKTPSLNALLTVGQPFDMLESPCNDYFYLPIENPRILPNGLVEERVRVDRKLYEKLLASDGFGGNFGSLVADEFFRSIMTSTLTEITWPSRLRLNTRSRKDPHIKIMGSPAGVEEAKNMIHSLLDTRINRVTLKMDVAFTDHSHVIGKGGRSIQKVMDSTGCHIHFPDSNRTNSFEKSNQVSIAGSSQGAEQARCRVRELLPVSVHYEIPLNIVVQSAMDPASNALQTLQRDHGINVTFKPIASNTFRESYDFGQVTGVLVSIRGSRTLAVSLRRGIGILLELLTAGTYELSKTPALIETEVAAQHHAFVMGRGNCNLRNIVQLTGAIVSFPEATVPYFNVLTPAASSVPNKRSNVKIRGCNFDCAYNGWLELMGYLPLLLIFDLPDGKECDAGQVTQLMEDLKVSILIKPKQKQNNKSVMVRGPERDSRSLFEVRRQILELDHSEVPYCCESHYWANHYSSVPVPSLPAPAVQQPMPVAATSLVTPTLRRLSSTTSFADSRARVPTETSLSSILSQQKEGYARRRIGRLDTIDSLKSVADEEYQNLCRTLFDGCSLTNLSDSFHADEVFGHSLPQGDMKRLQAFKRVQERGGDGSGVTSEPASDFGSFLSQTYPNDIWRRTQPKDTYSGLNRCKEVDADCSIV